MRHPLVPVGILLVAGLARLASADEAAPLASRLRDDCSQRELTALVREALPGKAEDLVPAAGRLAEIGGPEVLPALALLVVHRDATVRMEALHATAAVRWRGEGIREAVLTRLAADPLPPERAAALTALGWVGDGRDVPAILDAADASEPDVAAGAQQAFRDLTGLRSPSRSGARRRAWWQGISEHRSREVSEAWTTLDADLSAPEAWWSLGLLEQLGWLDVATAHATLQRWLRSADPHRRSVAIDLATALRLADLAEDLRSASRFLSVGAGRVGD